MRSVKRKKRVTSNGREKKQGMHKEQVAHFIRGMPADSIIPTKEESIFIPLTMWLTYILEFHQWSTEKAT